MARKSTSTQNVRLADEIGYEVVIEGAGAAKTEQRFLTDTMGARLQYVAASLPTPSASVKARDLLIYKLRMLVQGDATPAAVELNDTLEAGLAAEGAPDFSVWIADGIHAGAGNVLNIPRADLISVGTCELTCRVRVTAVAIGFVCNRVMGERMLGVLLRPAVACAPARRRLPLLAALERRCQVQTALWPGAFRPRQRRLVRRENEFRGHPGVLRSHGPTARLGRISLVAREKMAGTERLAGEPGRNLTQNLRVGVGYNFTYRKGDPIRVDGCRNRGLSINLMDYY